MKDCDIYSQRAAEARAQADEAQLANVKERCLRAEAAWTEMAQRAMRTERMRASLEAAKAAAQTAAQTPVQTPAE